MLEKTIRPRIHGVFPHFFCQHLVSVSVCGRFPYLQGTAVRYRVLTVVLRIAAYWFFQNGEMRSQESNYMYSSFTNSTIKHQNTQLTEKSVGITIRIFPDYPIEKSQYPINKKISGYYPIHQNFLSGALTQDRSDQNRIYKLEHTG